jgi:hypothetical protein
MTENTPASENVTIERGPARLDYSRRGIRLTLILMGAAMLLTMIFGAWSALQGEGRKNAGLLPRKLEHYALYPDGTLRYLALVYPSDLILVDDDNDFEPHTVTLTLPTLPAEDSLLEGETFGGTLLTAGFDPQEGGLSPSYTLRRELSDGQYYGADARLSGTGLLDGDTLTLALEPQTDFALKFLVIGLPAGSGGVDAGAGSLAPYRDVRVRGWTLYYYDITLLEGPETVRITWDALGDPPDADLPPLRLDENR